MALSEQQNMAVRDGIVAADFRLREVEVQAGTERVRLIVSALLERRLQAGASPPVPVEPTGIFPLSPVGGGEGGVTVFPSEPLAMSAQEALERLGERAPVAAGGVGVSGARQITSYIVENGSGVANNVFRSGQIQGGGVLVRVSGAVVSIALQADIDNGLRLAVSDVDADISTGGFGAGDHEILVNNIITGLPYGIVSGRQVTAAGYGIPVPFAFNVHIPVSAGQRFAVTQKTSDDTGFVIFEVMTGIDDVAVLTDSLIDSLRSRLAVQAEEEKFVPQVLRRPHPSASGTQTRVASRPGDVKSLLERGFESVGPLPGLGQFFTTTPGPVGGLGGSV